MDIHVACSGVAKRIGSRDVLRDLNWQIERNTVVGLVGASGAGKTTLLRIIAGLDACTDGRVTITHDDGSAPRHSIGMVFQNLALWPHLTAREHLQFVLKHNDRKQGPRLVEELFDEVALPRSTWHLRPAQLSGGEAQRLAIARALAVRPRLMLLDEPLAHVDQVFRQESLRALRQILSRRQITVIYVTHHWPEIVDICPQVAVLVDGRISQTGSVAEIFAHPASRQIAELTGPYVQIPRTLLDEQKIMQRPSPGSRSTPLVGEHHQITVRPQQLAVVVPTSTSNWTVHECQIHGTGWQLDLASGPDRLTLLSNHDVPRNQSVGIEVRCELP